MGETLDAVEQAVNNAETARGKIDLSLTPEEQGNYEKLATQKKINANLEIGDNDFSEDNYSDQLDGMDVKLNLSAEDTIDSDLVPEGGIQFNPKLKTIVTPTQLGEIQQQTYPGNVYISNGAVQEGKISINSAGDVRVSGKNGRTKVSGTVRTNGNISIGGIDK